MNNSDEKITNQGTQHKDQGSGEPQNTSGSQGTHRTQQRGTESINSNRGNFANDPERAREAGRKGGQS